MSGVKNTDSLCWLLIEMLNSSRFVVNVKSVVSPLDEDLKPGDVIQLIWNGKRRTAKLIAHARNRDPLDAMIKGTDDVKAVAGPSGQPSGRPSGQPSGRPSGQPSGRPSGQPSCSKTLEEAADYSSSGSSWTPSHDEEDSADSDTGNTSVKPKMRQQRNRIPKENRRSNKRRHTSLTKRMSIENILPDSFKQQNGKKLQNGENVQGMMFIVKNALTGIFNIIGDLKEQYEEKQNSDENKNKPLKAELSETSNEQSVHEDEEENSDELNRSTDNVLVTNKHKLGERNERTEDEWVYIGSGMTRVPRQKYKRINWACYTLATRTLLLALFPRSILATHSLTGKSSPAFKDKPAKMCLDPKIISDVVIEIMDRFDVTENLVRQIITTKCADECKMKKMREKKRKSQKDKNMSPDTDNSDKENENE